MRQLTRVLALVLTVAFALSTVHTHGHAGSTPDAAVAAPIALDGGGHGADRSPEAPDTHAAVDCPVCALLMHMLGPIQTDAPVARDTSRERFSLGSETTRSPPLFEHHRPPIARAV